MSNLSSPLSEENDKTGKNISQINTDVTQVSINQNHSFSIRTLTKLSVLTKVEYQIRCHSDPNKRQYNKKHKNAPKQVMENGKEETIVSIIKTFSELCISMSRSTKSTHQFTILTRIPFVQLVMLEEQFLTVLVEYKFLDTSASRASGLEAFSHYPAIVASQHWFLNQPLNQSIETTVPLVLSCFTLEVY